MDWKLNILAGIFVIIVFLITIGGVITLITLIKLVSNPYYSLGIMFIGIVFIGTLICILTVLFNKFVDRYLAP